MGQHISYAWILFSVLFCHVLAHPQCLDFRPPFEVKGSELGFCSQYSEFGCCSYQQDKEIAKTVQSLLKRLRENGLEHCYRFVKDISCQECSPYAAHIYDAEESLQKRAFPGLCERYCHELYDECEGIVPYLTSDSEILESISSKEGFCQMVSIPDVDYCYPDLTINEIFNQNISKPAVTSEGCLCLEPFAKDLRNPLLFEMAPDGSGRIFIAEQIGLVHIFYKNGTKLETPFMDLTHIVLTSSSRGDERGFLGLTFHPQFKLNRKFYIYISIVDEDEEQKIRISEFLAGTENQVEEESERVLLEVHQPYANHNGGELLFGVDGYLYAFLGDGGAGGDPHDHAQDKGELLGKVIRIDVNMDENDSRPYKIPQDNPFVNTSGARPEIYAYGVRNMWRCDLDEGDPETGYGYGRIICGDVGQNAYEEVDIIVAGGNYGWNAREGFECFKHDICGQIGIEELPIHAYPHTVGKSVTGGHVYRGCMNPNLQGQYLYGDFVTGKLFRLKEDYGTGRWTNYELSMCGPEVCFNGLVGEYGVNILSFGEDDDGEVYMLTTTFASTAVDTGQVFKVVDPRRRGDPSSCRSAQNETETGTTQRSTISSTTESAESILNQGPILGLPMMTCVMVPVLSCVVYYI